MTIRVGRIMRHEDVHGVSGTGVQAEVVEFSDGSVAVRWLGKDASTNCTASIKNVVNVHGHGGKTEVEWLWEQEAPPDPMDAVIAKKVLEAGGSTGGKNGNGSPVTEAEKDAEAETIADEIVDEAAEMVPLVTGKVVEKLAVKKVAQKVAEKAIEKVEDAPE